MWRQFLSTLFLPQDFAFSLSSKKPTSLRVFLHVYAVLLRWITQARRRADSAPPKKICLWGLLKWLKHHYEGENSDLRDITTQRRVIFFSSHCSSARRETGGGTLATTKPQS